jgi:hypothetical protein
MIGADQAKKDLIMFRYILIAILLLFSLLLLSACGQQQAQPTIQYELGELIYTNTFDDPNSWESFGFMSTEFGISDGKYLAVSPGGGYVTVSNYHLHRNVVIEVTVEQVSAHQDTSYGIECRAQRGNNAVGYYFMLSSSGAWAIRLGDGGRVRILVEWTESPVVNQGQTSNKLRAVCIDDYMAFYVNDVFVAETRYDWLEEGNMGLVVNSPESTEIAVRFDDVKIWEASLVETTSP